MADDTGAEHRRAQFTSLGWGELLAALAFVLAAVAWSSRLDSSGAVLALWVALVPLLVVLVQAGVYWLAARRWVGCGVMSLPMAHVYRWFRLLDPALLLAAAVVIMVVGPDGVGARVLAMGVWTFGVVEYLNYFVVRLAYPLRRWFTTVGQWRTPRLVRDLERSAASTDQAGT